VAPVYSTIPGYHMGLFKKYFKKTFLSHIFQASAGTTSKTTSATDRLPSEICRRTRWRWPVRAVHERTSSARLLSRECPTQPPSSSRTTRLKSTHQLRQIKSSKFVELAVVVLRCLIGHVPDYLAEYCVQISTQKPSEFCWPELAIRISYRHSIKNVR